MSGGCIFSGAWRRWLKEFALTSTAIVGASVHVYSNWELSLGTMRPENVDRETVFIATYVFRIQQLLPGAPRSN